MGEQTSMDRRALADAMLVRLKEEETRLRAYWQTSEPVRHCFIDDFLPDDVARRIPEVFPPTSGLRLMKNMREQKSVGNKLSEYNPLIGNVLLAVQDPRVVEAVGHITGIQGMVPDPKLYASGVSSMEETDFLNPHLDNSHDGDGRLYRVLNLLYYVTPGWKLENGGNLELWEKGLKNGHTVVSAFNRMVIMATNRQSWHSVSQVVVPGRRLCLSNYFFTPTAPEEKQFMHVTTFAGRPEEKVKGIVLKVDGIARNAVKRIFPRAGLTREDGNKEPPSTEPAKR